MQATTEAKIREYSKTHTLEETQQEFWPMAVDELWEQAQGQAQEEEAEVKQDVPNQVSITFMNTPEGWQEWKYLEQAPGQPQDGMRGEVASDSHRERLIARARAKAQEYGDKRDGGCSFAIFQGFSVKEREVYGR